MGEVGVSFERDWIYPLGTAQLEGDRRYPCPRGPRSCSRRCTAPAGSVPTRPSSSRPLSAPGRRSTRGSAACGPTSRFWQRRFALRKFDLPQRGPSVSARHLRKVAAETRCDSARRRRRPWGRHPLAGSVRSAGHRLRLREPPAPAGGRGLPGRGPVGRGADAQPHRVARCVERGRSTLAPARPAHRPRPARAGRHDPPGTGGVRAVLLDGLRDGGSVLRAVPHGRERRGRRVEHPGGYRPRRHAAPRRRCRSAGVLDAASDPGGRTRCDSWQSGPRELPGNSPGRASGDAATSSSAWPTSRRR